MSGRDIVIIDAQTLLQLQLADVGCRAVVPVSGREHELSSLSVVHDRHETRPFVSRIKYFTSGCNT